MTSGAWLVHPTFWALFLGNNGMAVVHSRTAF